MTATSMEQVTGAIRIFLQHPKEEVRLAPGQLFRR
jgi:hypothetical protein